MVAKNDKFWNGPQGSSDMEKDPLRRKSNKTGFAESQKDISKVVDEAWKIDDGFSGKLPNND